MTSKPIKAAGDESAGFDRRTALARLLKLAAGLFGLSAAAGCPGGSGVGRSKDGAAASTTFNDSYVVAMREVPLNVAYEITLNGRQSYLLHTSSAGKDVWLGVDRRCTHAGCKLSWDANSESLICPCHGSKFDARGLPIQGPAKRALKTWPVRTANGVATIETGKVAPHGQP